ncbi:hypothetical protein FRC09_015251 [Ceratobasidium sp. 395]|nr:hypothetical protein FRC09_015251 [Ceratobasidium sp. 395]
MRFAFASFVAAAVAAIAFAQPTVRTTTKHINPTPEEIAAARRENQLGSARAEPNTNAKRFAKHLPPLAPKDYRRSPLHAAPTRPTRTRVRSAPRAQTSPRPPVNQQCNILVTGANGDTYGFLTAEWNIFGEYYNFQPVQNDSALLVTFSYSPDKPSPLNFYAPNSPNITYPWFAGILGFASDSSNFGPGSYNYAYIGGADETVPFGPSVLVPNSFGEFTGIPQNVETAIWAYDPNTQAITAQWVNDDLSMPETSLDYLPDLQVILMTGDRAAVQDTFGTPVDQIIQQELDSQFNEVRVNLPRRLK